MSEAIRVQMTGKSLAKAEVVLVPCFAKESPDTEGLPAALASAAGIAVERTGWEGSLGQAALTSASGEGRPHVAVIGLGSRGEYDLFQLEAWLHRAVNRAAADGFRRVVVRLPRGPSDRVADDALLAVRSLAGIPYRYDDHRSESRDGLTVVGIVPHPEEEATYRSVAPTARQVAEGVAWCRTLANTPPNEADPEWMCDRARSLAEEFDLEIEVLGTEELEERGMGGILAVGKGSAKPPRMVRLSWGEGDQPIALVGKGVTFDSGGLSLKPPAAMDEMKFDKAGACTVMGIARALAGARVPGRYACYLAFAENMPDGTSYRPGDIVRCYSGKTVEILNTDAEGRMLLADALAWAEEDDPTVIVDFATLTGACVVALGHSGAGLFTGSDELANDFLAAAGAAGERLWRMPLWREFEKQMKGQHGDLRNVGSRWGGASTAAAFLAQFVEDRSRWAHVDIAGPAYHSRAHKSRFGATGYGVATAMSWLLRRAGVI